MSASSAFAIGTFNYREDKTVLDFLAQNSLYIVLIVVLVVWAGIFAYLYRVENKVKKLEDQLGKS